MDGHLTILAAEGGEGETWLGMALPGGVAQGARRVVLVRTPPALSGAF